VTTFCERLAPALGDLYACDRVNDQVRIRTPYLYPDGTVIDIFCSDGMHGETLSDLGETLGWLRTQGAPSRRSGRQRRLLDDICVPHNVELFKGSLLTRVRQPEALADAVTRLGQVCLRVADLSLLLRTQGFASVVDEVEEFLGEQRISLVRGEKLIGRSARVWTVDFHTRSAARSALVTVLSTGTRGGTHGLANRAVAQWVDLNHLSVGPEGYRLVSLFDDSADVWSPEDVSLVSSVSDIALWSRPDSLAELLAGAA